MKKCIKYLLTAFAATILFTSCFDPVLYSVTQDVAPEEATVSGIINSIARYEVSGNDFYFISANNGLRYKAAAETSHGSWKTFPEKKLPFVLHYYDYYGDGKGDNWKNPEHKIGHVGQAITKVMADKTNIYLVTVEYTQDEAAGITCPEKFHLWTTAFTATDTTIDTDCTWTEIFETENADNEIFSFYKEDSLYYTSFGAFYTNSPRTEHREAFIRAGNTADAKIYKLNGASAPTLATPVYGDGVTSPEDIDSAAYIGSSIYFFDSFAVATNETKTADATWACYSPDENTVGSKTIKITDGTSSEFIFDKDKGGKNTELSEKVTALAVTGDSLIIGLGDYVHNPSYTRGGITKTSLTAEGKPETKTEEFKNNASVQISSYYQVYTLLVADPSQPELDTDIYAGIGFKGSGVTGAVSYNSIGLWSYYPERKNWNRE